MNTSETNAFRITLQARLSDLSDEHGLRESLAVEPTPDDFDRIQQANDRDFAVGNLQRNAGQLLEVQAALQRIQAGVFGICASCEEDIKPKRLAAIPWASYCIACQEAADLGVDLSTNELREPMSLAA